MTAHRTIEALVTPGTTISVAGHGVLLLGIMVGGWFQSPAEEPIDTTDVSVISAEDFAALTQNDAPPTPVIDVPTPETPPVEDTASTPPAVEEPPAPLQPPVAEVPDQPDPTPEVPETPVVPDPVISEEPPVIAPPDTPVLDTPVIAAPSVSPTPIAAPRVGPVPTPEAPPNVDTAPEPIPPVADNTESLTPIEETPEPEAAPEETTTKIVTEADTPGSAAPATSLMPVPRPRPEVAVVEPKTETPQAEPETVTNTGVNDAINDALADALTNLTPEPTLDTTPAAPAGPPLTSGERDGLRLSVQQCWNTGSMSSEAMNVLVTVVFSMARDGTPDAGSIRMLRFVGGSEGAAQQAFDTARRAITRCGARGFGLPVEKYEQWREIEMTFNPEKMRFK